MTTRHVLRFLLRLVLIGMVFFIAGWFMTAAYFARKITQPSHAQLEDSHRVTYSFPENHGLDISRFAATSADGEQIEAVLLRPARVFGHAIKSRRMLERLQLNAPPEKCAGTVVMLHGFGGRKEHQFAIAERFIAGGLQCIAYDARAHGESSGEHCTYGTKELADLRHVIAAAQSDFGDLGTLLGFGNSMGGAVLLQSLSEQDSGIAFEGIVAVSPFASLDQLLNELASSRLRGLAPIILPGALKIAQWRTGLDPQKIAPIRAVSGTDSPPPIFLISGQDDRFVLPHHSDSIHRALPHHPLHQRASIHQATHRNVLAVGGDALYEEMIRFYWEAISQNPPRSDVASNLTEIRHNLGSDKLARTLPLQRSE